MALKPTIYKFNIALADLDNHHYPTLNLTLAQHPSESQQRMLVRLLAYCLHAYKDEDDLLSFTKGLSDVDEPDIWRKSYDDQIHEWIDVGEPSFDRLKKACRQAKQVFVYSFNTKSLQWYKQSQAQFTDLAMQVVRFDTEQIIRLSDELERTATWSITINEGSISVSTAQAQVDIEPELLQMLK